MKTNPSKKGQLLKELRSQREIISGEQLSAILGISRVSVWKHIHKLQELGYQIMSTPNGYQLIDSPDIPFPWEFADHNFNILYYPELPSTMDTAKDLARKHCPDLTVVVAGRQTQGRGRLTRQWRSDDGGLYFTMVLRPKISLVQCPLINFAASLVLSQTIQDFCRIDAKVKWPNDILVHDQKISGMLSEMEAEAEEVSFINIGIGINVAIPETAAVQIDQNWTDLRRLTGRETISRNRLASAVLDHTVAALEEFERSGLQPFLKEWSRHDVIQDRQVSLRLPNEVIEGRACGIDAGGALLVDTVSGRRRFASGEVSLRIAP